MPGAGDSNGIEATPTCRASVTWARGSIALLLRCAISRIACGTPTMSLRPLPPRKSTPSLRLDRLQWLPDQQCIRFEPLRADGIARKP